MQKSILDTLGIDVTYILIGMLVLIIILLVLIILNKKKIKKLEEKYESFMRGSDAQSLENTILEKFDDIDELKTKIIGEIQENLQSTYQKVGLVKYDAFREMGGNLSFALVLLNKQNTGFILNAMHSREGCYTYVKEIIKGESFIELAEEEREALEQAVNQDEMP